MDASRPAGWNARGLAAVAMFALAGCAENGTPRGGAGDDRAGLASAAGEHPDPRVPDSPLRDGAPQLQLPSYYHPTLVDNLEPEIREPLALCVHREFSRARASPPGVMIRELDAALLSAGVPEGEVRRSLAVFLARTPLPLRDMPDAWAALQSLYPADGSIERAAGAVRTSAPLPPGEMAVSLLPAAGSLNPVLTALWSERKARRDATWRPASIDELPVIVDFGVLSFGVAEGSVDATDVLRVEGSITATVVGRGAIAWERTFGWDAGPTPDGAWQSHEVRLEGPDVLTGETLVVEVDCTAIHRAGDGTPKSAAFKHRLLSLFRPVYERSGDGDRPGTPLGYAVDALGLDGEPLLHPSAAAVGLVETYRAALTVRRDRLREWARDIAVQQRRQAAFVGSPLESLPLVRGPSGGAGALSLDPAKPVVVIAGASWCGPCQALAPAVEELAERFQARGRDGAEIRKVSIEDDPDSSATELERYPDGILAPAQWEATGLRGVPAYIVVEGGVVREAGILSTDKIAEFAARYAGDPVAAEP